MFLELGCTSPIAGSKEPGAAQAGRAWVALFNQSRSNVAVSSFLFRLYRGGEGLGMGQAKYLKGTIHIYQKPGAVLISRQPGTGIAARDGPRIPRVPDVRAVEE